MLIVGINHMAAGRDVDWLAAPGGSQIQRFAQNFKQELNEQFWGAKRK